MGFNDKEGFPCFCRALRDWAAASPWVSGLLVVGSYGQGQPRDDSDIDIMILSPSPCALLDLHDWLNVFGYPESIKRETWGIVESLRVLYRGDVEVEFTVGAEDWASLPLDSGTREVLKGGALILYDNRGDVLSKAVEQAMTL